MPLPALNRLRRSLACIVGLALGGTVSGQSEALVSLQKTALEWARLKDTLAQLETDWESERQWLESALDAAGAEEERLQTQVQRMRSEYERASLGFEKESAAGARLDSELSAIKDRAARTAETLMALRPLLPPRLSSALDLLFASLADEGRSAGERLDIATSIIDRCLKFDGRITYSQEPLSVETSGDAVMMEVVYWGLSHGYALDRSTGRAYFGNPAAEGWRWRTEQGLGEPVAELIGVFQGEKDPAWVPLPAAVVEVEGWMGKEGLQ